MKTAKLVRQPNNDACSAFYIDDSKAPFYVRDERVEVWREQLQKPTTLMMASLHAAVFESKNEVDIEVAKAVVDAYDRWRRNNVSAARNKIAEVVTRLDATDRAALLDDIDTMKSIAMALP